jgi:enoyl-CoA hydratase
MSDNIVTLDVNDHVALVTLNRPPVNALNRAMRDALIETFDAIAEREDIRVAVLTGAGKTFCAGADLKDRPDPGKVGAFHAHNRVTRETGNAIRECAKPVIAAVNGAALGAGLGLMAACDIYLVAEDAQFGMPEIDVGLAGGGAMLRTIFGRSTMRRLMYTGDRLTGTDLLRRGIVEEALPRDALLPTALEMARRIGNKSPLAINYAKKSANMVDLMPQRDAYRFEQDFTVALSRTEDAKEARTAFVEKRKPVFTGR